MGIISKILFLVKRTIMADIVKVFSFTAMSTFVRMLTGLISVKVVAVIIGPSGIALLGQLNNFTSIIMNVAGGGINVGVTKYIAEYKDDKSMMKALLSTALKIMLTCSLLSGIIMIALHSFLSKWIMMSDEFGYVFVIFGLTLILYALNMLLVSILNGFKEFKKYVLVNIIGSIVGLIFTISLVFIWQLKGALISAVTYQSVVFFISLWMIRKFPWVSLSYFRNKFDKIIARKYFKYTLMTLTTATIAPFSQMMLRGYVITELSAIEAGWWEAMNRISNMYLMVITSSFSVYYLPRLSEITDKQELKDEVLKAYKVIVPIISVGFIIIYLLRFFVIKVLFTEDFSPMAALFKWQLLGDFFKICSWLLAFIMVAKSMTKTYISTEIIFATLFLLFGFILVGYNGIEGIAQAHMAMYILYFLFNITFYKYVILK